MRNSILRDLYFGDCSPWERRRVQDPEYDRLIRRIDDIEAHFRKTLSAEEYERLEEFKSASRNHRGHKTFLNTLSLREY